MQHAITFLAGGIVTSLLFPLGAYFVVRVMNKWKTAISIEPPYQHGDAGYTTLSLRVTNNSMATLKNLTAFISITYSLADMWKDPNLQAYSVATTDRPLMLSWAKLVDGKNLPHVDLNQLEPADLNLIRNFAKNQTPFLQIASEEGFSNAGKGKARAILQSNKNYDFQILLTADNIWPIKTNYRFISKENVIIKI